MCVCVCGWMRDSGAYPGHATSVACCFTPPCVRSPLPFINPLPPPLLPPTMLPPERPAGLFVSDRAEPRGVLAAAHVVHVPFFASACLQRAAHLPARLTLALCLLAPQALRAAARQACRPPPHRAPLHLAIHRLDRAGEGCRRPARVGLVPSACAAGASQTLPSCPVPAPSRSEIPPSPPVGVQFGTLHLLQALVFHPYLSSPYL